MYDILARPVYDSLLDVNIQNPLNLEHPLAQGLIGFWLPLPSLSGGLKLYDLSLYSRHGTLTNMDPATAWTTIQNTPAIYLDGVDESIYVGKTGINWSQSNPFTIFVVAAAAGDPPTGYGTLVNAHSVAAAETIVYLIASSSTGRLHLWKHSEASLPTTWKDGNLHSFSASHPAGANNGQDLLYYDGRPLAVSSGGHYGWTRTNDDMRIGSAVTTAHEWYGWIAAVMIYNRVLTASEHQLCWDLVRSGFPALLNRRPRFWPVVSEQAIPKMVPWHLFQQVSA